MDNVSHTLAGLIVAEGALAFRRRGPAPLPEGFGRIAWLTSALANNIPDADLLSSLVEPGPLGYLLHHRGYTHTVVIGLVLGVLCLAVPWAIARRRRSAIPRDAWALLAGLALLGPMIHLALDFSNNYGVHPFWPLSNRWFYGDAIFIVEPWFWVVAIPLLLPSFRSRAGQVFFALLLGVALVVPWVAPFVPRSSAIGLTVLAAALLVAGLGIGRTRAARVRMPLAVALSLLGVTTFAAASVRGHRAAREEAARAFPGWRVDDVVVTPIPATPECGEAILVMTRGESDYAIRRARVTAWPGWRSAAACPRFANAEPSTMPVTEVPVPSGSPHLAWDGEFVMPLARLREISADCEGGGFLRFARAPFVLAEVPPVVGDARYDREEGIGFSELRLTGGRCPRWMTPWVPPREDLLR